MNDSMRTDASGTAPRPAILAVGAVCLFVVGMVLGLTLPWESVRLAQEKAAEPARRAIESVANAPDVSPPARDGRSEGPEGGVERPEENGRPPEADTEGQGQLSRGESAADAEAWDAGVPRHIQRELRLGNDRWKEIKESYPLAIDQSEFIARGSFENRSFITIVGNLPPRPSPPEMILDRESARGRRLPAARFKELNEILWGIEEEKARVLQKLYERQNVLLAGAETILNDVETWVVRENGVFLIRRGDDEEHAQICGRIDGLRKEYLKLIEEHLESYGEAR